MNKDTIHGAMDNLSKILGYTAPEEQPAQVEKDKYEIAAARIKEYVLSSGFEYKATDDELSELYDEFNRRFSPEVLQEVPDEQLLRYVFYSSEGTNDSLCYWLEFNPKMREFFGSIAGGSSYKFGLFQKKENGTWITGSSKKPEELTEEAALDLGKQIRDTLIHGAQAISEAGQLNSKDEYDRLDTHLNGIIGKYASLGWIHKYYHMLFPELFCTWHATDWQRHMLLAFGIIPSNNYYGRSGQLAIIARKAEMNPSFFAHAAYDMFGGIKQFLRIGTTSDTKKYGAEWRAKGIVALGWNGIGNLEDFVQDDSINQSAVQDALKDKYFRDDARTASRKAGEISTFYSSGKDSIYVPMDGERLLGLCDSVGKYYYDETLDFANVKTVKWHTIFSEEDRLPNKSEGLRTTCVQLKDVENLLYLYDKYYNGTDIVEQTESDETKVQTKHIPRDNAIFPLNMILYGAPGTGKTYSAVEYAVAIINKQPFSLSTDEATREAVMAEYEDLVEKEQIVFTTFHQNYGYEEFIQGIRPHLSADTVSFRKADGIFKNIADRAMNDPDNNYVIIIDEINRGNISKIFGELITLIEDDKRWGEKNQLRATLLLGDTFAIPNNLYIIGTMNTADKSISLIDVALRRRFDFVGMYPDLTVISDSTLRDMLDRLNRFLRAELNGTDLLIGHSFFVNKSADDLGDIMNKNIIPLLYEYFFDEEPKIRKALECLAGTDFTIDNQSGGRISVKRNKDD